MVYADQKVVYIKLGNTTKTLFLHLTSDSNMYILLFGIHTI